jgi:ArsR family transcriptional regulator, lead/cadmium/zinc/bismuth-responsive transcriptional repressor
MSNLSEVLERCEVETIHPQQVRPLLGHVLGNADADRVASAFSLLADPTRTRILHALSLATELCVCDMAFLLGISQSALSHQLRLLRAERVVARRKAGRLIYYRLQDDHVRGMLGQGIVHSQEAEPDKAGA